MQETKSELKFDIKKNVGIIGEGTKGWKKEVNIISWNDRKPKLDIRDWDESHEKMGKGVTLNSSEVRNLIELLKDIEFDEFE